MVFIMMDYVFLDIYKDNALKQLETKNIKYDFVCNSVAKLSVGSVYRVMFSSEKEKLFFLLSEEVTILDKNNVENWATKRGIIDILYEPNFRRLFDEFIYDGKTIKFRKR